MQLEVNGIRRTLSCRTAFEARALLDGATDIVILNGFQLDRDHPLADNDTLTIIPRGVMPDREQLESMMMARHTPAVHKKLKQGRVAIAGLGGLGSNIAVMLARIGVGHLLLVDFDSVEPSNLNRQSYYIRHLGMPKTLALQSQLAEINPFVSVETRTVRVEADNVAELFAGWDILCEAFDKPAAKAMLVSAALEKLPGVKIVAASGLAGFASANAIRTARPLERLYLCGDLETAAAVGTGLMAPRVQVCAGHQANTVLRLLAGIEEL